MNPHYNQNYTREEIDAVLAKIKSCVEKGRYTISLNENRQENIDFINEYNIRSDKQKSILMQIETEDFSHSLQNTKIGYEYEVLYVFVPQVQLFNADRSIGRTNRSIIRFAERTTLKRRNRHGRS